MASVGITLLCSVPRAQMRSWSIAPASELFLRFLDILCGLDLKHHGMVPPVSLLVPPIGDGAVVLSPDSFLPFLAIGR
jgi:hypothetical protein